ncbi:hypothetical protein GCM10010492_50720 [Saccharothrix mutabilis subsp. mutabilis]|uniref:IrrE N-terminal-like domain-containing protein n=1 Tax=Saccharothrix mutabilis subsp. mutabilis TaxID=66855 RepID=A0ABP3DZS3_9PSEU
MRRWFPRKPEAAVATFEDVHGLCAELGARRRRPILLLGTPLGALGVSGLWLAADHADVICYESDTSRPHQEHIILHELGHILHGHARSSVVADALGPLFSALEPDALRVMLARRHRTFSEREEREAEDFAYAVLARRRRGVADGPAAKLLRVLGD